jgi:glycerol-3-phosphate O-acyltransferase
MPMALAVALSLLALLGLGLAGRALVERRSRQAVRALRREFRSRVDRFQRRDRDLVRQALLDDAEVAAAVAAHTASTGETEERAWARVREYADEIVPGFSLLSYYHLGYRAARIFLPLFYKVSVGYEAREALNAIPPSSVVVYLMNHRSNADYVLVAYVLSGEVAISYAVGEWARVWPLETVFKSFGSYFVRRRYKEALYHKVLERYVQLITRNGVTQGLFPEGGLSRDGAFRPPKLGILDYLLGCKRAPALERPLTIVPVAINYDRVLEDRSLLRELQGEDERLPRRQQVMEVVSYVTKVSLRFLLRRARRYGRACVNFGAPLSVDEWLAARPGILDLPRGERLARMGELANEVMARIAAVMPVTAVSLASAALLRQDGDRVARARWESTMDALRDVLAGRGAHVIGDERSTREILDRALVMLTLRRVVEPEDDGFRVDPGERPLLRYYANAIEHFLAAAP